ncbi:stabilizer of axonemal microtubules 2-like [Prorops nasuta]|uniref:stabilizer of axonemal microtubules 2-like n=1 Tax=Prorops nasuta TaxID=863751 RepID=UPI0034CD9BDE
MQICPPQPLPREKPVSVVEYKNKFKLDHDESCNCAVCCSTPPPAYRYIQPEVPRSFAPVRQYCKSNIPLEDNTVYKLSYWENPPLPAEPIRPDDRLKLGQGPISDETTHKLSYVGNWCVKPEECIMPCDRQLLGRGPMQDVTTQKHDFTWKCLAPPEPIKERPNLYNACAAMSDDTTYKLSYFPSGDCTTPTQSYAPIRNYERSDVPMEGRTTYNLSYWPNEPQPKEENPWEVREPYKRPVEPMAGNTTYNLSFWPTDQKPPEPIINPDTENILNAKCCFDGNTTYGLSYFGCGGDTREPIRQPENILFSGCPVSHDTTNRLSYMGNWCVKPEAPIRPCDRQLLGRGPMQEVTTQKHDFTWKSTEQRSEILPEDNLQTCPCPLSGYTTHKLSYLRHNCELTPTESYAPIREYRRSEIPLETETTMKLSYQPVGEIVEVEKPWANHKPYHPPVTPMQDNTTYHLRFVSCLHRNFQFLLCLWFICSQLILYKYNKRTCKLQAKSKD